MSAFETYRYFLMTVDPVHVGTGGTRLGRVDMSIVREPGTRLPKIPGTSLSGAIRAYAAYRYGKRQCAGQGQSQESKHCGQPTCPICYTFGTASESGKSYAGVVSIGDARILLFPVYSMVGPVWVTSPTALQDAGLVTKSISVAADKAKWDGNSGELPTDRPINLGWLMVEQDGNLPEIHWPKEDTKDKIPEQIRKRVVLVSDKLFSQIVNSNLEVRTSVSINPETGAAEDKALFTYEAIPRATVLWMDVVVDDYRDKTPWQSGGVIWKAFKDGQGEWHDNDQRGGPLYPDPNNPQQAQQGKGWKSPIDVVRAGLEWAEHLGIGGMGTRGFGRVRPIAECGVEKRTLKNCHDLGAQVTSPDTNEEEDNG